MAEATRRSKQEVPTEVVLVLSDREATSLLHVLVTVTGNMWQWNGTVAAELANVIKALKSVNS